MTTCSNTGVAVPECSCARCLEDLLRRHQPDLLTEREPVPRGRLAVLFNGRRRRSAPSRRAA